MRWLKNTHLYRTVHLQNIQVCMYSCKILWCCCTQRQHCSCAFLLHTRYHLQNKKLINLLVFFIAFGLN